MKVYCPGVPMIPILLLIMGVLSTLDRFGIMQFARIRSLWPVTLIATGMEEIYLWSISKNAPR